MENWNDIPGYNGLYQASDMGRVRSLDRFDSVGKLRPSRILKPNPQHHGYHQVTLCGPWGRKSRFVHVLVCQSFLGIEDEMEVDHLDGDKSNNSLSNLEYVSRHENVKRHHSKDREIYVRFYPKRQPKRPYIVSIRNKYLGSFKTESEAVEARDLELST